MNLTKSVEGKIIKGPISEKQKQEQIELYFSKIMESLGLDLSSDSLKETPARLARLYVRDLFMGLNVSNKPKVKLFKNTGNYSDILLSKDITFYSCCAHHFLPFFGSVSVAYIPKSHIIGLSKMNRLVKYLSRRPQVQESLTVQIAQEFQHQLSTEDVAVLVEAKHLCVHMRGIEDTGSSVNTAVYLGAFTKESTKQALDRLLSS